MTTLELIKGMSHEELVAFCLDAMEQADRRLGPGAAEAIIAGWDPEKMTLAQWREKRR